MENEDLKNPDVSADTRYDVRAEIENQFVRGLLTINGGAAAAGLAFSQAVVSTKVDLAKVALIAVLLFGLGVFFAALVNLMRYKVAYSAKVNDNRKHSLYSKLSWATRILSLLSFLCGIFYVSIIGISKL